MSLVQKFMDGPVQRVIDHTQTRDTYKLITDDHGVLWRARFKHTIVDDKTIAENAAGRYKVLDPHFKHSRGKWVTKTVTDPQTMIVSRVTQWEYKDSITPSHFRQQELYAGLGSILVSSAIGALAIWIGG